MASSLLEPFFINTKEFGEKAYSKCLELVDSEQRDNITLDMVNFNICFSFDDNLDLKINLCNLYKKCFVDLYGKLSGEEVDSMINEFVTNSLHGLKDKCPLILRAGIEKVRDIVFPIVRRKALIDDYNKTSCSLSADHTITFFPFRCFPDIGVSLATIQGPLICSIHKGMIRGWCKEPRAERIFKTYAEKEDLQLDLILDTTERKDTLKEEIALLRLAKENFTNLIKKKYKKGASMWHRYPSSAYKAELKGEEYSNLSGSLLLLPELIAESKLKVKGDILAVAAEESALFIGGSQDPLALCFIGDLALEFKDDRNHISLEPLRLMKDHKGLSKWSHYVPNTERREYSVPINKGQVDMIFKSITSATKNKNVCTNVIPVFNNLSTPLGAEAQEMVEQNLKAQKMGKPHTIHVPICWYCGSSPKKLKQCEGCLLARYCERKCQKAHWKLHKKFCKSKSAEKST